jgi:hypothetical protein
MEKPKPDLGMANVHVQGDDGWELIRKDDEDDAEVQGSGEPEALLFHDAWSFLVDCAGGTGVDEQGLGRLLAAVVGEGGQTLDERAVLDALVELRHAGQSLTPITETPSDLTSTDQ